MWNQQPGMTRRPISQPFPHCNTSTGLPCNEHNTSVQLTHEISRRREPLRARPGQAGRARLHKNSSRQDIVRRGRRWSGSLGLGLVLGWFHLGLSETSSDWIDWCAPPSDLRAWAVRLRFFEDICVPSAFLQLWWAARMRRRQLRYLGGGGVVMFGWLAGHGVLAISPRRWVGCREGFFLHP